MLNNQDFAQIRRKSLGGSDIAAVLGIHPYMSPTELWLEKTGKSLSKRDSLALRFGQFAENFVANEYAQKTQLTLIEVPCFEHPQYQFITGHVDRLVMRGDKPHKVLECKTSHPFNQSEWGQLGSDEVPMHYLCQCLWYLMLSELPLADLAVLFGNSDYRIYTIERDQTLELELLQRGIHFWQEYVQKDQPPSQRSMQDNQKLFQEVTHNKKVEASIHIIKAITELEKHENELNQLEQKIQHIKSLVMNEMQDAEILIHKEQTIATWKRPKTSYRFDSRQFESDQPDVYKKYLKPIENSRRLVIKGIQT